MLWSRSWQVVGGVPGPWTRCVQGGFLRKARCHPESVFCDSFARKLEEPPFPHGPLSSCQHCAQSAD